MTAAALLRGLFLLSLWVPSGAAPSSSNTLTGGSTCPSRTVNYITHSLPQQCLTSLRALGFNTTTTQHQDTTSKTSGNRSVSGETSVLTSIQTPGLRHSPNTDYEDPIYIPVTPTTFPTKSSSFAHGTPDRT